MVVKRFIAKTHTYERTRRREQLLFVHFFDDIIYIYIYILCTYTIKSSRFLATRFANGFGHNKLRYGSE